MSTQRSNAGTLAEIEVYARRHYPDLSLAEHALYFDALRIHERKNGGMFKKLLKSEDEWARESGASRPTVRKALHSLQTRGLIRYTPGNNGSDGQKRKKAVVRRCTIEEIKKGVDMDVLHRFVPANAEALAERLNGHGVPWNGCTIKPRWNVAVTGRLNHKGSPMTAKGTNTKKYRLKAFRKSLRQDEVLIEADWIAAEPTVLCHALNKRGLLPPGVVPEAIYEAVQDARSVDRAEAKKSFQKLVYSSRRVLTIPGKWKLTSPHFLRGLVDAVSTYREDLWQKGKPTTPAKDNPRFVYTLTGRKLTHDGKRRTDRGDILAWQLQGTVADVFTPVVEHVLNDEAQGRCRFFFPCHDAVYVAVKADSDYDPAAVMRQYADLAGIPLRTKTKRYGSCTT